MKKKESILLAFNEVVKLDRVMYDILDVLCDDDLSDLQALPEVRLELVPVFCCYVSDSVHASIGGWMSREPCF